MNTRQCSSRPYTKTNPAPRPARPRAGNNKQTRKITNMPRKFTAKDFQTGATEQQLSINEAGEFLSRLTRLGIVAGDLSADVRQNAAPGADAIIPAAEIIAQGEPGIADQPIDVECIINGQKHNVRQLRDTLEVKNGLPTLESYAHFIGALYQRSDAGAMSRADAYVKALELPFVTAAVDEALQNQYNPQQAKGLRIQGAEPPKSC